MKHLFIVNPVAGGKRHSYKKTIQTIEDAMAKNGGDFEIYVTKGRADATRKVKMEAEAGGELRVYACGGDGTFNECVNGCVGYDNTSVTVYPCGTGNDFVRLFEQEKELFSDIDKLINGFSHPVDIICCNGRYSVNICSLGFDARVGGDVHKYSKLPLIRGMGAYIISVIVNFFKGINQKLTIKTGDNIFDGEYALICACNGRYYGGGFNPINDNMPDDGVMDTLVVNKCSRLNMIRLIKKYSTGRYREAGELVERFNSGNIIIEAKSEITVNIDGEIIRDDKVELQLVHNGIRLLCPHGVKFFEIKSELKSNSK